MKNWGTTGSTNNSGCLGCLSEKERSRCPVQERSSKRRKKKKKAPTLRPLCGGKTSKRATASVPSPGQKSSSLLYALWRWPDLWRGLTGHRGHTLRRMRRGRGWGGGGGGGGCVGHLHRSHEPADNLHILSGHFLQRCFNAARHKIYSSIAENRLSSYEPPSPAATLREQTGGRTLRESPHVTPHIRAAFLSWGESWRPDWKLWWVMMVN